MQTPVDGTYDAERTRRPVLIITCNSASNAGSQMGGNMHLPAACLDSKQEAILGRRKSI